ncbi:MAG: OsmC family protein [Bdellovibrio sp.]|nr:OsmC family protein [Bdellovibrio sp.]
MVTGNRRQDALVADLNIRTHKLVSGLTATNGGNDEGPNPHEMVEAALAACTILTVQMYANHKGMKLESTDVAVKITSEGADSVFSLEVSFRGDLTPEERERLGQIAQRCPIHKLLVSNIKIETTAK